jgi:hypothetical protein
VGAAGQDVDPSEAAFLAPLVAAGVPALASAEDDGEPRVGDTVAIVGRKASRGILTEIGESMTVPGERWALVQKAKGFVQEAPLHRVVLIERAAEAAQAPEAPPAAVPPPEPPAITSERQAEIAALPEPDTSDIPEQGAEFFASAKLVPPKPVTLALTEVGLMPVGDDVVLGDDTKWYRNTETGLMGPFATEADALAAAGPPVAEPVTFAMLERGGGDDAVKFRDVPMAEYGLTPSHMSLIDVLGVKANAARAKPAKPPRPSMLSAASTAAASGVIPPRLVFTSAANTSYQKHADAMFALAVDLKRDELSAYPIKGSNTYSKALQRWRSTALPVVDAKLAAQAAGELTGPAAVLFDKEDAA